jgi:hypothetical protein
VLPDLRRLLSRVTMRPSAEAEEAHPAVAVFLPQAEVPADSQREVPSNKSSDFKFLNPFKNECNYYSSRYK